MANLNLQQLLDQLRNSPPENPYVFNGNTLGLPQEETQIPAPLPVNYQLSEAPEQTEPPYVFNGGMLNPPSTEEAPRGMADSLLARSAGPAPLPPAGMAESLKQRSGDDLTELPPPMGMAESLRQRSGDDLAKLTKGAPGAARKESAEDSLPLPRASAQPEDTGDDELAQAIANRDRLMTLMMLGKGAERVGTAISGTESDKSYLDLLKPIAENKVSDVFSKSKLAEAKADLAAKKFNYAFAKDKNDPNSPSSKFYRDTLKELSQGAGMSLKIPPDISASEIEKIYPNIINIVNAKEARESRMQIAEIMSQYKKNVKKDKEVSVLSSKMAEALDPSKAKSGNFAKNQNQVMQAENLEALFTDMNGNIRNLDSRQQEELAIGLNRLLSGTGTGARSQIEALVPHTVIGSAKKLQEWLTNNPTGLGQTAFVKRMAETITREKELAQRRVLETKMQRLSAFDKLKELDPEAYDSNMLNADITPAEYEKFKNQHQARRDGVTVPTKLKVGEIERQTQDGRIAIFDSATKKFIRYKE